MTRTLKNKFQDRLFLTHRWVIGMKTEWPEGGTRDSRQLISNGKGVWWKICVEVNGKIIRKDVPFEKGEIYKQ